MHRFVLACLAVGVAGTVAAGVTVGTWFDHTSEFQLPNGLKVVVLERPASANVSLTLLARAGWADDPAGKRGVSRVMERIVEEGGFAFGSKNIENEKKAFNTAEELADKWQSAAAKPNADELDVARLRVEGEAAAGFVTTLSDKRVFRNTVEKAGGTWTPGRADATAITFSATLPPKQAEVWFTGMGAWLKDPAWRDFYRHRNEAAQTTLTVDEQKALLTALSAKANTKHAFAQVEAIASELQNVRVRDLTNFHKQAFAPGNLVLAVAGAIDAATVRALAEKHFGPLAAGPAMTHNWEGREHTPYQLPDARPGMQVLAIGYRRPSVDSPDDAALDVIGHLLFSGPDSILQTKLVRNLRAMTISGSLTFPATSHGLLCILAIPVPGQSFDQLEKLVQAAIDETAASPLRPDELLAAKRRFIASSARLLDDDESASDMLARNVAALGSVKAIPALFDQLESLTPQQIQASMKKYLVASNRTSITWLGVRP